MVVEVEEGEEEEEEVKVKVEVEEEETKGRRSECMNITKTKWGQVLARVVMSFSCTRFLRIPLWVMGTMP